jgi:GMC oxidoreductase
LRLARTLHSQEAFGPFRGEELDPGAACQSDRAIDAFMHRFCSSHYHPVGTCKMGSDGMSVVDHELRVHGLSSLRVADASIMPRLVGGNTNAPAIMIGDCFRLITQAIRPATAGPSNRIFSISLSEILPRPNNARRQSQIAEGLHVLSSATTYPVGNNVICQRWAM